MAAGGGFETRLLLGNALHWSGRAAEADTELAPLVALARTDAERAEAAIPRVATLFVILGRPTEAEAMLDAVASAVSDDTAALELAGMRSVLDAFLGRTVQAAEAAAAVLAHPRCSPPAAQLATWGLAAACGDWGRLDGLGERVQWIDARADSFETGLHQEAVVGSSWVRGLVLAGLLVQAEHAARRYRERCQDTPGIGDVITSTTCAAVAQSRGQVKTAARWFRQFLTGSADTGSWAFTLLVDLPGALGMVGDAASARKAFRDMTAAWNPAFAFLEPEVLLAQAWVAAAEGSVSEARALARQAAELAADDGSGLHAASVQLEQMGALLLAADAAAQAAAAHARQNRRGSAQAATTRAHRLAEACEGARTPALGAAAAPLPLTSREREIVTLAGSGLSNRQIAERLTLSIRTIEGHLYRACAKLGTSDRAELAALLHGD